MSAPLRCPRHGARAARPAPTTALLLLASLVALAASGSGCGWFRGPSGSATQAGPAISAAREVEALPGPDGAPGRLRLLYKDGDFTAPPLVVPAGHWDIEVFNFNNPRPVGFFLRLPDRYGRELEHLATGGGIEMGSGRVFRVTLVAGQDYFYSCPITDTTNHVLTAVALAGEGAPSASSSDPESDPSAAGGAPPAAPAPDPEEALPTPDAAAPGPDTPPAAVPEFAPSLAPLDEEAP